LGKASGTFGTIQNRNSALLRESSRPYLVAKKFQHFGRRTDKLHSGFSAESWLGLSEQEFRVDKWNICLVHAAAICGSQLK
jgi:hypothetical protein